MIKFNDNNIYVGYIKQLLKDFNLPNCQVYKEEFKDFYNDDENNIHIHYIKDNAIYLNNKVVSTYKFNDKIFNITNNLHNTSMIYDSKTHKYLGEYLRFIRDYTGLDLMQMYNCFTNESPVNLHLNQDAKTGLYEFDSDDDNYQLFILPIKFNKVYTIGLDCSSYVSMRACNYEYKDMVNSNFNYDTQYASGTRFNHPFIYESPKVTSAKQLSEEDTLKLVIKIPTNCRSSIVVLEGDYRRGCDLFLDSKNQKQVLASTVQTANDNPLLKYIFKSADRDLSGEINYYISKPQLLYLNTQTCYLLADRLCEYLSRNTIDSNEEIDENIRLVQKAIHKKEFTNKFNDGVQYEPDYYGIWDDDIRDCLYNFIFKSSNTFNREKILNNNFDMLGYFDKDVESHLQYLVDEDTKTFEM